MYAPFFRKIFLAKMSIDLDLDRSEILKRDKKKFAIELAGKLSKIT